MDFPIATSVGNEPTMEDRGNVQRISKKTEVVGDLFADRDAVESPLLHRLRLAFTGRKVGDRWRTA